jgi:phosphoribosylaminoimidazolecarboxamide formyltransferase/IMP cyclohydrolase
MDLNRVEQVDDLVAIQTALISVADKTGLEELVEGLVTVNPELTIYSTGGTFNKIKTMMHRFPRAKLIQVSDYTGQPEMQGGLVKTLDFKIYLGLLSETYNSEHQEDLKRTQAQPIDLVVVNLYPFRETVENAGATIEDARTNIDIGGPCMLRASAKNFLRVSVLSSPELYTDYIARLQSQGGKSALNQRLELSKAAFKHSSEYEASIAAYFEQRLSDDLSVYKEQ